MGRWEKKHRPPPPPPPSSCAKVNLILSCNQRVTLMKPQQAQHLIRVKSKLTLKIFAHIPPFLTHTLWIQWSRTSIHLAKGGGGGGVQTKKYSLGGCKCPSDVYVFRQRRLEDESTVFLFFVSYVFWDGWKRKRREKVQAGSQPARNFFLLLSLVINGLNDGNQSKKTQDLLSNINFARHRLRSEEYYCH